MILVLKSVDIPILLGQDEAKLPFIYSVEGGQVCMMMNDIILIKSLSKSLLQFSSAAMNTCLRFTDSITSFGLVAGTSANIWRCLASAHFV